LNGFSDPYVKFVADGQVLLESPVVKKTLDPEWNFECSVAVPGDSLTLSVFDKDTITKDDPLGEAVIDLSKLTGEASDLDLALDTQGTVSLSIAAPPGDHPKAVTHSRVLCFSRFKQDDDPFAKRPLDECIVFTAEESGKLHFLLGKMKDNGSFAKEDDEETAFEGAVGTVQISD
jgi:C2 domain